MEPPVLHVMLTPPLDSPLEDDRTIEEELEHIERIVANRCGYCLGTGRLWLDPGDFMVKEGDVQCHWCGGTGHK